VTFCCQLLLQAQHARPLLLHTIHLLLLLLLLGELRQHVACHVSLHRSVSRVWRVNSKAKQSMAQHSR
jgi:hypothetical protein